jgi:hypothetical protein
MIGQVDGGAGHSGRRSPDIHFGLGNWAANSKVAVELKWRDIQGQVQHATLELAPGWHTVLLGKPAGTELSREKAHETQNGHTG